MKKILFLVSGNGTNYDFINTQIKEGVLFNCKIIGVVSNKDCLGFKKALNNQTAAYYKPWSSSKISRTDYDKELAQFTKTLDPDIIVLAGWNHILGTNFLKILNNKTIINLHPALINQFPGNNSIEHAWDEFQKGKIQHTGIMVHKVTDVLDVGEVIAEKKINIETSFTLKKLYEKIQFNEKFVLLEALEILVLDLFKKGKVKNMYNLDNNRMVIFHTDRLSSCNSVICSLEGKGELLSLLTNFWFNKTDDIIKNHVIEYGQNHLIVEKCELIPIEFIVRGYITGSMWKKYESGARLFCGNTLKDGLKKYQKLDQFIITPTTKDDEDRPINYNYILENKIVTLEELDYIYDTCAKLYILGQYESLKNNLILCDTKYEFGRNQKGEIVLIDEIHTIESSRYWRKDTYTNNIDNNLAPDNYDKDIIRTYIQNNQFVPESAKKTLLGYYKHVYETLSGNKIDSIEPFTNYYIKNIFSIYKNN